MPTTLPADLVHALSGRYALADLLGRGGMATVYRARDEKHQRDVAIKVLRPEIAASVGAERFLKEIEIVARLTHPHVLGLYDSGDAAGFLYYVMPLIEGGSLRAMLSTGAPFDVARALAIAAPVADALSYAHRMGVVHRDIKPENILFSQGHPVVSDFGIARVARSATDESFTRTGMSLGTPGYMSPEQAAGARELSERSDVYSLAVVVYEMLVGEVPSGWPSEDSVQVGRLLEAPDAHREHLDRAGARVEAALVRGLAIRQADRTPTPEAFIADLRGQAAPPVRRRYGRDEVDAIVRRATELEAQKPTMSGALTMGGIEAVAAEVGVSPALLREAEVSLRSSTPVGLAARPSPRAAAPPGKRNIFAGGPTRLQREVVVDGEVPVSEFPTLVEEIRRFTGLTGVSSQLGRSVTWTSARQGSIRDMEVSISLRGGQTRIAVRENLGNLIGAVYGGVGGGVGGGVAPLFVAGTSKLLAVPTAAAATLLPFWFLGAILATRGIYAYAAKRRERVADELAARLAEGARELIAEARRENRQPSRA